jgi:hypothetical protein
MAGNILSEIIHSSDKATGGYFNAMATRDRLDNEQFDRNRMATQDQYAAENMNYKRQEYQASQAQEVMRGLVETAYGAPDISDEELLELGNRAGGRSGLPPMTLDHIKQVRGQMRMAEQAEGGGLGKVTPGDYTPESLAEFAQTGDFRSLVRYEPFSSTDIGGVPTAFNRVTGQTMPGVTTGGAPIDVNMVAGNEAARAGAVVSAQETARTGSIPARTRAEVESAIIKTTATNQQEAVKSLPAAIDKGNQALAVIDGLINHDGLDYLVGVYSLAPIVPGSPQADADAYMKQIEGQAFLEAFSTLKGGGQITEVEGRKATEAILRLSRKQSKEAFTASLNELRGILQKGMERAEKAAAPKDPVQSLQQNLGSKLDTSTEMSDEEYEAMKKRMLQ